MAHRFYDPEFLRSLLLYDAMTGTFTYKPRTYDFFKGCKRSHAKWTGKFCGKQAFTAKDTCGYLHTKILGKVYLAHKCAWVIHYGAQPKFIDHINGNKQDNRIENLRDVSIEINARNRVISRNNTSGFPGVRFSEQNQKWHAYGTRMEERIHLGYFSTKEDAIAARQTFNIANGYIVRTNHD